MRTVRLSLVGTVIMVLLGGLVGLALAQEADTDARAVVSGTEVCRTITMGTETSSSNEPGVSHFYDHLSSCRDEMSDPRVTGVFENTFNEDCYWMADLGEDACVIWGTHVMEGDEGGWDCAYTGTDDLWGPNGQLIFAVCPGTGEYAGLTYVFHHVFGDAQDFGDGTDFHGVIYDGPPPAWGHIEPPVE
jgi:hypothetical protein